MTTGFTFKVIYFYVFLCGENVSPEALRGQEAIAYNSSVSLILKSDIPGMLRQNTLQQECHDKML